jgi:hypothetical protein
LPAIPPPFLNLPQIIIYAKMDCNWALAGAGRPVLEDNAAF